MSFFKQFPLVNYDYNRTGTIQQIVNIFRNVRAQNSTFDNTTLYKTYYIKNGERPDIVSEQLYGTSDYYWTFFILNDFLHDGLQAWPMSQEQLTEYININYSGKALLFKPTVFENETNNSIAGKLELGGLVYGRRSGAVGRIIRKDIDLNLIVLKDIIPGSKNRNPFNGQTDESVEGMGFQKNEFLQSYWSSGVGEEGLLSLGGGGDSTESGLKSLSPHDILDYSEAPAFYYVDGDREERPVTSPIGIQTLSAAGDVDAAFSELQWNEDLQNQITTPSYSEELINVSNIDTFIGTNADRVKPLIYTGGYRTEADDFSGEITYKTNRVYVSEQNEKNSTINVINPKFIEQFVEEFESLINA